MQKCGGVHNSVPLEEVAEAERITVPKTSYTLWSLIVHLPMIIIKLTPITLLLMAIMWGISYLLAR